MKALKYKLGEFCHMKYGKMPKKKDLVEDGYPIFSGYRIVGHHKEYLYKKSEIVVVARGVGGCGDIKISPPMSYITNLSIVLQPDDEICDKIFLYYRLKSTTLKELNTGAAQPQIIIDNLKHYEVKLPHIHLQKQIASILSAYDNIIENNTRRIAILEEMARRIYTEWFVNFRFPGHEKVKMVDSELGQIPSGWEIRKLSDVASVNKSSIKKEQAPETIRYIDIKAVSPGCVNEIRFIFFIEAPSRARRKVKTEDIIWSTVRPNRRSYALILDPQPDTIVSTGFAVISPESIPFSYLYCYLTTDNFVEYLSNHATGAAYPAVNQNDFKNSELLLPDKGILKKYHSRTESIFLQAHVLQKKNDVLKQTRDLLLPKLISGEIEVSELEVAA
jgi:type I restriction enzyme, S subunit